MSSHLYLPDTSIWIDIFRQRAIPTLADRIRSLSTSEQLAMTQIVRVELLHGTRTRREYDELDDDLRGMVDLPVRESTWDLTASLGFDLRHKGRTAAVPDLLIAASAIEHEAVLIHSDKIFVQIAEHSDLRVESYVEAQI